MREIKFRAWDIESPAMISWDELQEDWESEEYYGSVLRADHWIPMQYIEREDKHGVEIYEDDIITASGVIYIIKWARAHSGMMWCAVCLDGSLYDYYGGIPDVNIEIIGNKHENPELLEEIKL